MDLMLAKTIVLAASAVGAGCGMIAGIGQNVDPGRICIRRIKNESSKQRSS